LQANNSKIIRALFVSGGIIFLILTLGFFFQLPWATSLWPWPDGRLSHIFIAAITAAIAAPMIWIGLSGEFGAARGGAISLGIVAAGTALYLFYLYTRSSDQHILIAAIIFAIFVPLNLLIYFWCRKIPIRDQREKPLIVEFSFMLFVIMLILVSSALIRQAPRVFPWSLKPESSLIFGLLFIGALFYFLTALRMPKWHSARGQLLGFLAYDLVLIGPFLVQFNTTEPSHKTSLLIYTLVLAYSSLLAIYFLFINKTTRSWHIQDRP
jgi:hypothetical protein